MRKEIKGDNMLKKLGNKVEIFRVLSRIALFNGKSWTNIKWESRNSSYKNWWTKMEFIILKKMINLIGVMMIKRIKLLQSMKNQMMNYLMKNNRIISKMWMKMKEKNL